MKETVLKSVLVAFDEAGQASIQLQHAERLTVDGELIRETYLPHERFSLSGASSEEKATLKAALGKAVTAQGEQIEAQAAALEGAAQTVGELGAELAGVRAQLEARDAELIAARAETAEALAQLEAAQQVTIELPESGLN